MSKRVSGNLYDDFPVWNGKFLQKNLVPFSENTKGYLEARGFDCRKIWENAGDRYTQNLCSKQVGETHISFYQHVWTRKDESGKELTADTWEADFSWDNGVRYYSASYLWADTLFMNPLPDTMAVRVPDDCGGMRTESGYSKGPVIDHVIRSATRAGIFSFLPGWASP